MQLPTLQIPVVLFAFNRPEKTAQVLETLRTVRPRRLWVVCDGARPDRPGEDQLVAAVREQLERADEFSGEVRRIFSDENLGCGRRVSSGLDTVFATEHAAIILEDDCVPLPEFFRFCAELLERYCDDARVGHIAGAPFFWERIRRSESYLFSRYGPVWGWATWRRAWKNYDLRLADWPRLKATRWLEQSGFCRREAMVRSRIFDRIHGGDLHTWDYQWSLAKWRTNMLSIVPTCTMVQNTGLLGEGTHRHERWMRRISTSPLAFPLSHPREVRRDAAFDAAWSERFVPSLPRRVLRRLFPSADRPPLELA